MPHDYQGDILVPFPIESALSGVQRLLAPDETLWYRRMFTHQTRGGHRTHLHFEAVDYECTVYLNGKKIGSHKGSSDPFKFDITDVLRPGDNELTVSVIDQTAPSQTLGKQSLTAQRDLLHPRIRYLADGMVRRCAPATFSYGQNEAQDS